MTAPPTIDAQPGDIVRLDNGSVMLVHSRSGTARWPITGWRIVPTNELKHRQDYEIGPIRALDRHTRYKVRSCEIIHGAATGVIRTRQNAIVDAVVRHARANVASIQWEAANAGVARKP